MAAKMWLLVTLLLTISTHICTGLKCYACVSSTNAYNSDCDKGTSNVRFGTCPANYRYCSVKKYAFDDGTQSIVRDCDTGSATLNEEVEAPQGRTLTWSRYCQTDFCNTDSSASKIGQNNVWIFISGAAIYYSVIALIS